MSNTQESFFTSVGCMDGRAQCSVAKWGRERFGVKFVDAITEAGLVGLLARKKPNQSLIASIKNKINISLEKHHSKGIVVHGHEDCAGNPVSNNQHKKDVLKSAKIIGLLIQNNTQIIPVFVESRGENWVIEELKEE